jgi:hypothetical protein
MHSLVESMHIYVVPCLADILSGFGLTALLEFSRNSPDMQFFVAICMGVILALGVGTFLFSPCQKIPAWVALCNTTYSLVVTLALSLNLLSQLCPPNGKDLSLIPVYALLCVPRMPPSGKALAYQAGAVVLLLGAFLVLPTSRHVRPSGDVGSGMALAVSMMAGCLQTFDFQHEPPDYYFMDDGYLRWWRAGSVMCKGLLLVLLGSVTNTSLYHFMYDRPNTVPRELFIAYGILLLFASMQTASVWFGQLKQVLGNQAKWRLVVRIQHIIYALVVAAAWIYPLQLHTLRLLILSILLLLNFVALL